MGVGGIPSAAAGSVIGLNRSITTQSEGGVSGERLTGMIQVDAQVVAGDSGGPLYDAQGEVMGMDTAASSTPMQSVGFAIPIAKAVSVADQIENGHAGGNIMLGVPGFLGIQFQPGTSGSGAVIAGVVPKTPAAGLGLLPGDTLTSLSGSPITSGEQLKTLLSHYRGGDSVSLTWRDSQGGSHTASVTLIDGPAE
jgi:S1-C subfamily serine protease